MNDTYKETTHISYGQKLKDSLVGVLAGLVLFFGACGGLWWNEGRSVDRIKALDEGRAAVVAVQAGAIDPTNEGKLVHFSGKAETSAVLVDSLFNVQMNALKMKRTVNMYQWQEKRETRTKKEIGGGETQETIYTYNKIWSEQLIDSNKFKDISTHGNPRSMPYSSEEWVAAPIHVGAFELAESFTNQISKKKSYLLTDKEHQALPAEYKAKYKLINGTLYSGSPESPQIGDIQIGFSYVEPLDVSVIGKQRGDHATPYAAKTGTLALLKQEVMDAPTMFNAAETENSIYTWIFRVVGFIAMWGGLGLFFRPLKVLADVVPFIGSIIGAGIGGITGLIAFSLSLGIISVAWLFYRPLIGGGILVLAVLVAGLFYGLFKKRTPVNPLDTQNQTPLVS